MLTADYLDSVPDPIITLYYEFEEAVVADIARRLKKMKFNSAAWQVQRLSESGMLYKEILKKLSVLTGKSEKELRAIFQKAGVKAMKFDDAVYRTAGLEPLPLNLSPAMGQVLAAGLKKTHGIMQNLTLTTAIDGQQAFIRAADLAYMQVSSGAFDYTSAITQAVKKIAADGLSVINFASGRKDQLDVAVRRAVLTGVSQTAAQLQLTRADEMECDLVATSAHAGARPTHEVWQGQVFSRSGKSKKYPGFVTVTGYGTGAGLCGWNCRHSFYPFFEDISENAYSQEELNDYRAQTVKYNGKTISVYEATQEQRSIERKIRYWKRQAKALEAAGLEHGKETAKVKEWQGSMRDFVRQMNAQYGTKGIKWLRQPEREKVGFAPNLSLGMKEIDFKSKEYQKVTNLGNVGKYYPDDDPGKSFVTSQPVIYNQYAATHIRGKDRGKRLEWLQENAKGLSNAIQSPDFIEQQIRVRKDGHYSITLISELRPGDKEEDRFMVVAMSLSKNLEKGFHQITTIHPTSWKDLFYANGDLKPKYRKIK